MTIIPIVIVPVVAAAAAIRAQRACGVLVALEPTEFQELLHRMTDPILITAEPTFFLKRYQYLTSYRGLAFHCVSKSPLELPKSAEVIAAKSISIPG